jgi:hypothetical protein
MWYEAPLGLQEWRGCGDHVGSAEVQGATVFVLWIASVRKEPFAFCIGLVKLGFM